MFVFFSVHDKSQDRQVENLRNGHAGCPSPSFLFSPPCENTPPARGFWGLPLLSKGARSGLEEKDGREIGPSFFAFDLRKKQPSRMLFLAIDLLGNDRPSRAINPMILNLRGTSGGMLRLALPSESAHFTYVKSSVLYFTSKSLNLKGVNFHEPFHYSSSKNEINST